MNVSGIDRSIGVGAAPQTPPVTTATVQRPPDSVSSTAAVPAAQEAAAAVSDSLHRAASRLEDYVRSVGRSLQFRVDQNSGRVVVSVRDLSTGELIRQIPSETALNIAETIDSANPARTSVIIDGLA